MKDKIYEVTTRIKIWLEERNYSMTISAIYDPETCEIFWVMGDGHNDIRDYLKDGPLYLSNDLKEALDKVGYKGIMPHHYKYAGLGVVINTPIK